MASFGKTYAYRRTQRSSKNAEMARNETAERGGTQLAIQIELAED